jgi:hypothetical protein
MKPTIDEAGEVVLVDIFSHKVLKKSYKKGDVVIVINPQDPKKSK